MASFVVRADVIMPQSVPRTINLKREKVDKIFLLFCFQVPVGNDRAPRTSSSDYHAKRMTTGKKANLFKLIDTSVYGVTFKLIMLKLNK